MCLKALMAFEAVLFLLFLLYCGMVISFMIWKNGGVEGKMGPDWSHGHGNGSSTQEHGPNNFGNGNGGVNNGEVDMEWVLNLEIDGLIELGRGMKPWNGRS